MFSKSAFVLLASLLGACAYSGDPAEQVASTSPTSDIPEVVAPPPAGPTYVTCAQTLYTYEWPTTRYYTYECDAFPGGDCVSVDGQPGQYRCSGRVEGVHYVCDDV